MGVARGVFSNEAGLGSAPMAHAAARTTEPMREGFVAMLGPFIDTIVVCSVTALAILVTGVWQVRDTSGELLYGPGASGVPVSRAVNGTTVSVVGDALAGGEAFTAADGSFYPIPTGSALTAEAFAQGFGEGLGGLGRAVVALGIILFAYSTMISWSYYGDRCWEFLLGPRAILPYRIVFCICVIIGSVGGLRLIWLIADNLNALMAIPNLIALLGLSGLSVREGRDYIRRMKDQKLL
jgi:AGCS family alanine or glycine:cation symporter